MGRQSFRIVERQRRQAVENSARDTLGQTHVFYDERWDSPWTRWIPLVKIGDSSVARDYFAMSAGKKIFIGHYTSTISSTVYGFCSAGDYAALVTASDRESFLRAIRETVQKQRNSEISMSP